MHRGLWSFNVSIYVGANCEDLWKISPLAFHPLCILAGLFLPKIFSGFPFSVSTAGSLMAGSLFSCVFHTSPRIPEVSSGSASSDTLWEVALVFSPQRAAHAPGWSSKENEDLVFTEQQNVASQQNISTFCHDPYIHLYATYTQRKRTDILSHPKWSGCNCLKENVQKCVLVFMNYFIFYTISICTSALNSKNHLGSLWISSTTMGLMSTVYISMHLLLLEIRCRCGRHLCELWFPLGIMNCNCTGMEACF